MTLNIWAQQAREHQLAVEEARQLVARHLAQRDTLVRRAYAEGGWSYGKLAKAVGLTPELVARIINPQDRGPQRRTGRTD